VRFIHYSTYSSIEKEKEKENKIEIIV